MNRSKFKLQKNKLQLEFIPLKIPNNKIFLTIQYLSTTMVIDQTM